MNQDTVYIRLLGTFTIQYRDATLRETMVRDSLSWVLLKYIVANGERPIDRDELERELWPERASVDSDGAMRVRLRRLREALDTLGLGGTRNGLVLYGGGQYRLNPALTVQTDVSALAALSQTIFEKGSADDVRMLRLCMEAIGLCRGAYLENSAPASWLDRRRGQYTQLFSRIGILAASLIQKTGCMDGVEPLCTRALRIAPQDMELHAALLAMLLDRNQLPQAVQHYAQLYQRANAQDEVLSLLAAFEPGP